MPASLGGVRGIIGLLLVALGVGMAYGSLAATVLNQWLPTAGTLLGFVLLGAAASLAVLLWLVSALLR
jgi:predicted MFS family arabinose efflux permease